MNPSPLTRNIEPHWPNGAVAILQPVLIGGNPAIQAERRRIRTVTKTETGWLVVTREGDELVLDEDGESPTCVPWDSDVEEFAQETKSQQERWVQINEYREELLTRFRQGWEDSIASPKVDGPNQDDAVDGFPYQKPLDRHGRAAQ